MDRGAMHRLLRARCSTGETLRPMPRPRDTYRRLPRGPPGTQVPPCPESLVGDGPRAEPQVPRLPPPPTWTHWGRASTSAGRTSRSATQPPAHGAASWSAYSTRPSSSNPRTKDPRRKADAKLPYGVQASPRRSAWPIVPRPNNARDAVVRDLGRLASHVPAGSRRRLPAILDEVRAALGSVGDGEVDADLNGQDVPRGGAEVPPVGLGDLLGSLRRALREGAPADYVGPIRGWSHSTGQLVVLHCGIRWWSCQGSLPESRASASVDHAGLREIRAISQSLKSYARSAARSIRSSRRT